MKLKRLQITDEYARPHSCEVCAARFRLKHHLRNHVRIVHEGKKLYCTTCNAAYILTVEIWRDILLQFMKE